MKPAAGPTTRIAALLLCMVMALLSAASPHCGLCDGPHAITLTSASHPSATHPSPVVSDACNGVCACCGFHWLPDTGPLLSQIDTLIPASYQELPSPGLTPRTSLFRPPRTAVSS